MSTTELTTEQADEQARNLLEDFKMAKSPAARKHIQRKINEIVLMCSTEMQNRLWTETCQEER